MKFLTLFDEYSHYALDIVAAIQAAVAIHGVLFIVHRRKIAPNYCAEFQTPVGLLRLKLALSHPTNTPSAVTNNPLSLLSQVVEKRESGQPLPLELGRVLA